MHTHTYLFGRDLLCVDILISQSAIQLLLSIHAYFCVLIPPTWAPMPRPHAYIHTCMKTYNRTCTPQICMHIFFKHFSLTALLDCHRGPLTLVPPDGSFDNSLQRVIRAAARFYYYTTIFVVASHWHGRVCIAGATRELQIARLNTRCYSLLARTCFHGKVG